MCTRTVFYKSLLALYRNMFGELGLYDMLCPNLSYIIWGFHSCFHASHHIYFVPTLGKSGVQSCLICYLNAHCSMNITDTDDSGSININGGNVAFFLFCDVVSLWHLATCPMFSESEAALKPNDFLVIRTFLQNRKVFIPTTTKILTENRPFGRIQLRKWDSGYALWC